MTYILKIFLYLSISLSVVVCHAENAKIKLTRKLVAAVTDKPYTPARSNQYLYFPPALSNQYSRYSQGREKESKDLQDGKFRSQELLNFRKLNINNEVNYSPLAEHKFHQRKKFEKKIKFKLRKCIKNNSNNSSKSKSAHYSFEAEQSCIRKYNECLSININKSINNLNIACVKEVNENKVFKNN